MNEFTRSEKPFLLLAEDKLQNISYYWFDDEDELQMIATKIIDGGGKIIDAIEIQGCREIDIVSIWEGYGLIDESLIKN